MSASLYFLRNGRIVKLRFSRTAFLSPSERGILTRTGESALSPEKGKAMGTGACGISCDACRLKARGLCSSCGAGTETAAREKLDAQARIFQGYCPVLKCAFDRQIAYCPRDCRRFPCRVFEQGPYPFSQGFLEMQKRRRKETRPPTVSLDEMTQWEQDEIDAAYWEELRALDPAEVCRRSLGSYDTETEAYRIPLVHRVYRIYPFRTAIAREGAAPDRYEKISFSEALVLVLYLLRSKEIPLAGRQLTEKDLPGGATFFRGPHEMPRRPILKRFGRNPERFIRAALCLGGRRLDYGDAACRFQALPRVPLDCILWTEDEEFPARLTLAFDATVSEHLPLDVIWALAHLTTRRLVEADEASP